MLFKTEYCEQRGIKFKKMSSLAFICPLMDEKCTVNVPKFQTLLFLFSNKMLVFRDGIHKMQV